jgi:cell fate (sporulation/competence/biofilm development) regulator YmcA (YheA/YmcA/DUF963 family)
MKEFQWDNEKIEQELNIDNSSVYSLTETMKQHSKLEAKYQRLSAMASKEVYRLDLERRIVEAALVDEYMKEQSSQSASLRQEIRKSIVKDKRYQAVSEELRNAQEVSDMLRGLVNSWVGRGYQLREIAKLAGHTMADGPKVYVGSPYKKSEEALDKLEE